MLKKIFTVLILVIFVSGCSKAKEVDNTEVESIPTANCGNKICEVFIDCPDKNCPPSEYPHTCPEDCKLTCTWSTYKTFCEPTYRNIAGDNMGINSHLTYILDNYGCETSLDCPFSHQCTEVKFNDPEITEGKICIINPLTE